mmetsp:Transcript_10301/g.23179  ORF Transcript_10301/g.23179 Transcript_10301/m.23179 type:complete len:248 (-) Transcript_10301:216-959(-)
MSPIFSTIVATFSGQTLFSRLWMRRLSASVRLCGSAGRVQFSSLCEALKVKSDAEEEEEYLLPLRGLPPAEAVVAVVADSAAEALELHLLTGSRLASTVATKPSSSLGQNSSTTQRKRKRRSRSTFTAELVSSMGLSSSMEGWTSSSFKVGSSAGGALCTATGSGILCNGVPERVCELPALALASGAERCRSQLEGCTLATTGSETCRIRFLTRACVDLDNGTRETGILVGAPSMLSALKVGRLDFS